MATQPRKRLERVQYFETHLAPFTTNMTAIGLATADITGLTTKTELARELYTAQQAALTAAKSATQAFYDAVTDMGNFGDDCINKIRGKAKTTGNPEVYTLAQIDPPAPRTPVTTLGTPSNFKANLQPDGSLKLTWKCVNPRATGTVYNLSRRVDDDTSFTPIGGTGKKEFVDATVPLGTTQVVYRIRATRSTAVGTVAEFIVSIGNVESGQLKVTQPKLAA